MPPTVCRAGGYAGDDWEAETLVNVGINGLDLRLLPTYWASHCVPWYTGIIRLLMGKNVY